MLWVDSTVHTGDIVGQYQMEDAVSRPFLLRDGVYSQIIPTAAPGGLASGIAFSISDNGMVLGTYRDLANVSKTWVMRADGTFEYPVLPGTSRVINNAGQIAGSFADTNNANAQTPYVATPIAPLPEPLAFTFQTFDIAGASETLLSDIRNDGTLVGRYKDGGGISQGFVQEGTNLTTFNVTGTTATFAGGIDSFGRIAGLYRNATNPEIQHGFIRETNGTFTTSDGTVTFHPPGAVEVEVFGLNDRGQIVGEYADAGGARHGFIAQPAVALERGHTDVGVAPFW